MESPDTSNLIFWLALMFVLLLANGLFVAFEFALVAVRRSRIQEMVETGRPFAPLIKQMQEDMDRSIAGAQLGITLASLALGWVAENSIHRALETLFHNLPGDIHVPSGIGVALSFVILSMLHVIIGEQVPKSWALRSPENMIFMLSVPFKVFATICAPLIALMNWLSNLVLKLLRIPKASGESHAISSADEFLILFEQSAETGALDPQELDLLNRSLELKELTARQLMVPRGDIIWLNTDQPIEENLRAVEESPHQRFPVGRGSMDDIIGIVQAKSLLSHALRGTLTKVEDYVHEVLFVPENRSAQLILKSFQDAHMSMAIVLDEYGSVRGLMTINDIVSSVVGDLPASADIEEEKPLEPGEGPWVMDASMPLHEFQRIVEVDEIPESDRFKFYTLAGFVIDRLERIPKVGDSFEWNGLSFEVIEMDRHRIANVLVRRLPPEIEREKQEQSLQSNVIERLRSADDQKSSSDAA